MSKKLLDWRQKLERQFVYRPDSTSADRAVATRARIRAEATVGPLKGKLRSGPENLTMLANRMRQIASTEDVLLVRAKLQRDQAICDLNFLGIAVPHIPAQKAPASARTSGVRAQPLRAPTRPTIPFPTPLRPPVALTRAATPSALAPAPAPAPTPTPTSMASGGASCPRCSQPMRQRLARKGRNAGSYFWGCSRYPSCKGTRPI